MKFRLAAAVLALTLPSGLAAQDINLTLDQTLVENFDGNVVPEALEPFNVTVTQQKLDSGATIYHFAFPGGLSAVAQPVSCRDAAAFADCTHLRLTALFELPPGKTPEDMIKAANVFNARFEAAQVIAGDDGKSRLVHYVIGDFGITKTNLMVQIYNFRQAAMAYHRAVFATSTG